MGRLIAVLGMLVCFLLSGCELAGMIKNGFGQEKTNKELVLPDKQDEDKALTDDDGEIEDFFVFYEQMLNVPKSEIAKHLSLAEAQYKEKNSLQDAMEYTLILLLTNKDDDLKKAERLIGKQKKNLKNMHVSEGVAGLIDLLHSLVERNKRDRMKRIEAEKTLATKTEELETLQQQLSALKSIDKNIHEREVGTINDGR